ncbi:hypothetical protein BH18GEM1_BH18GEM1_07790 [soil metagenome]
MTRRPQVSVCIPARDRGRWLGEALESVFRQTMEDFEVVVYDDASTDDTPAVVDRWSDPRLRYFRHARPVGVASNRNACLAVARGRYIAWLDSDDRYHPQMLAVQSAALDHHPQAGLAHGGFEVIDADGRRLPDWPPPFTDDVVEPGREAFRELVVENYVTAPTVLVRRDVYDVVGPYSSSLPTGEDWEMWLRIALHADLVYTAEAMAQYRWHAGSLARRAAASGAQLRRDLRAIARVFEWHAGRVPERLVLERRVRAAVAARAVLHATDCLTRAERGRAMAGLLIATSARSALCRSGELWRLLSSAARGDEYGWHVRSRALLARLADTLAGSRYGERLRAAAIVTPGWEETLSEIARTVREIVPPEARVAVVDKWDPTVLHLSRRSGWHFPDRKAMPEGYPRDSAAAIRHLAEMRRRGARYLVFPCAAFWWLEHYVSFARDLEESGARVWKDERCVIYRLAVPGVPCAV